MVRDVTPELAVAYLNQLLEIDKKAIEALVLQRVPCEQSLAAHPTVQVAESEKGYAVGFLGVLNGMFGTHEHGYYAGWGPLMAEFQDGELRRFALVPVDA